MGKDQGAGGSGGASMLKDKKKQQPGAHQPDMSFLLR
jgi:hypothetical protein